MGMIDICRDGIRYERNRIDDLRKYIEDCRYNIVNLRKHIQEAREVIEQLCEKCAESLNELEEKYHITNIAESADRRIGELISDVRCDIEDGRLDGLKKEEKEKIIDLLYDVRDGYDAMNEDGGLNKEIKAYVRGIVENQDKIGAYEKIIQSHCERIDSYKKLIVENGWGGVDED